MEGFDLDEEFSTRTTKRKASSKSKAKSRAGRTISKTCHVCSKEAADVLQPGETLADPPKAWCRSCRTTELYRWGLKEGGFSYDHMDRTPNPPFPHVEGTIKKRNLCLVWRDGDRFQKTTCALFLDDCEVHYDKARSSFLEDKIRRLDPSQYSPEPTPTGHALEVPNATSVKCTVCQEWGPPLIFRLIGDVSKLGSKCACCRAIARARTRKPGTADNYRKNRTRPVCCSHPRCSGVGEARWVKVNTMEQPARGIEPTTIADAWCRRCYSDDFSKDLDSSTANLAKCDRCKIWVSGVNHYFSAPGFIRPLCSPCKEETEKFEGRGPQHVTVMGGENAEDVWLKHIASGYTANKESEHGLSEDSTNENPAENVSNDSVDGEAKSSVSDDSTPGNSAKTLSNDAVDEEHTEHELDDDSSEKSTDKMSNGIASEEEVENVLDDTTDRHAAAHKAAPIDLTGDTTPLDEDDTSTQASNTSLDRDLKAHNMAQLKTANRRKG
ncbi:MAG: hypothetical protein M1814_004969 [Vezdaea aestivalis]|nr:MAG: hypothetical protein M1814_004969 [Vezdaea aestivalis]